MWEKKIIKYYLESTAEHNSHKMYEIIKLKYTTTTRRIINVIHHNVPPSPPSDSDRYLKLSVATENASGKNSICQHEKNIKM